MEGVEQEGHETGAWRGEVDAAPQTPAPHQPPPEPDPALENMPPIMPGAVGSDAPSGGAVPTPPVHPEPQPDDSMADDVALLVMRRTETC